MGPSPLHPLAFDYTMIQVTLHTVHLVFALARKNQVERPRAGDSFPTSLVLARQRKNQGTALPEAPKRQHAEFNVGFILAALTPASLAGFRIGAILWAITAGLFLRAFGQPTLAYLAEGPALVTLRWLVAGSGGLEGAGVLLYVVLLVRTLRGTGDIHTQPAFGAVRPYFAMMVAGWLLYAGINLVLLFGMALRGSLVVNQAWNEFAIQGFIELTLLPVAMAHSVRIFPKFLALSAPFWPVRGTAYVYLLGVSLHLTSTALSL